MHMLESDMGASEQCFSFPIDKTFPFELNDTGSCSLEAPAEPKNSFVVLGWLE